jgi:hypothetical protein
LWKWCRRTWTQDRAKPRLVKANKTDCWLVHARLPHYIWFESITEHVFPWPNRTGPDQRLVAFQALRQRRQDVRSLVLIHGHTHVPYVLVWSKNRDRWMRCPICYGKPTSLSQFDTVLLNPGSVGQPRNPDPLVHAAYGILDTDAATFEFRRAPYDSEPTRLAMPRYSDGDFPYIWFLEGAHPWNPLWAPNNWLWQQWKRNYKYKEQTECWEPVDPDNDL